MERGAARRGAGVSRNKRNERTGSGSRNFVWAYGISKTKKAADVVWIESGATLTNPGDLSGYYACAALKDASTGKILATKFSDDPIPPLFGAVTASLAENGIRITYEVNGYVWDEWETSDEFFEFAVSTEKDADAASLNWSALVSENATDNTLLNWNNSSVYTIGNMYRYAGDLYAYIRIKGSSEFFGVSAKPCKALDASETTYGYAIRYDIDRQTKELKFERFHEDGDTVYVAVSMSGTEAPSDWQDRASVPFSDLPSETGLYLWSAVYRNGAYESRCLNPDKPADVYDIADCTITLGSYNAVYTGKAKKPSVTVKDNGRALIKDTDYTVTYSNNVNAGTAKAVVKGKGIYTGNVTKTFKIKKATIPIRQTRISFYYDSEGDLGYFPSGFYPRWVPCETNIRLVKSWTDSTFVAKNNKDVKITSLKLSKTKYVKIKNNKFCFDSENLFKAYITAKFSGNKNYKAKTIKLPIYHHSVEVRNYLPDLYKIKQLKNRQIKMTITKMVDECYRNRSGYKIFISKSKSFPKKSTKIYTISSKNQHSKVIKGLKKGKYYFKVLPYKKWGKEILGGVTDECFDMDYGDSTEDPFSFKVK